MVVAAAAVVVAAAAANSDKPNRFKRDVGGVSAGRGWTVAAAGGEGVVHPLP